jgi:hypothetical protein
MNLSLLVLIASIATLTSSAARAQEVWFAPQAPGASSPGTPDWEALFNPTATSEWATAAARTDVFSWNLEHMESWPTAQLAAEAAWVHAHGMKLAVTLMPLETSDPCGQGEGYMGPGGDAEQAARMKQAGVLVDLVQMDGPLYFGHYADGLCQWPIATVASHVAAGLAPWLAAFPAVHVAEIEEAPVLQLYPTFEADYVAFKAQVEQTLGAKITHLQFDVTWSNVAIDAELPELFAFTHAQGMRFGVFYDGNGDETSDTAWIKNAETAMETAEGLLGVIPDDAEIASWDSHPVYTLPDTAPSTLSWLVREYGLPRTIFQLSVGGGDLRGRLSDDTPAPVAGAEVLFSRLGIDPLKGPPSRVLTDRVPAGAAQALLGWRINNEYGSAGANDVVLGALIYAEVNGRRRTGSLDLPALAAQGRVQVGSATVGTEVMGRMTVAHLQVAADQSFQWNGSIFPVTADATFSLSAPIGSMNGAGMFGYGTVIFMDADGNGLSREFLVAPDTSEVMGAAATNATGDFYVRLPTPAAGTQPVWRATYAGSATERPTEAQLAQ